MVYLHLPSSFTDEEVMLQNKYEKLKKKKKALQSLKAPRQEPERSTPVKRPQVEGRDAREIARKLIKSGAISAIKKAPKREEMSGFKRPTGSERGRRIERNSISGYQPFSGNNDQEPMKPKLYESPVKSNDEPEHVGKRESASEKIGGNTIFVQGGDINEQLLREIFSDYGSIVNINMEAEKNRGFVTFEEPDSAAAAISGANDLGPHIHSVSYARRQPQYNNSSDSNKNSKMWSSAAARKNGSKGNSGNKEQHERTIVCYDSLFD